MVRVTRAGWGAIAVLVLGLAAGGARAQQQSTMPPPGMNQSVHGLDGDRRPGADPDDFGFGGRESESIRIRRENARKVMRKQNMVTSANRLLELTKLFRADLALHPEMTPENAKRLDDIAKLARDVRSRMQE